MRKALIVPLVLALVAVAAVLAAVASARPNSAKQHVVIAHKGNSFVLTPTSPGAVKSDRGAWAACCWTHRHVVVAGQRLELDNPRLTLTGRNGTLELRNRITFVGLPDKWAIFTGTWKVIGGTGAYSGLSGDGQVFGTATPGGYPRVSQLGFLTSK